MYPISNNSFNVFDMNDLDANYLSNFDNYQWKYSFKFQNQNQSKVFLKALTQLRQQANHLQQKKKDHFFYHLYLEKKSLLKL